MIPSALAGEITQALKDFLATGFGPSNAALATVMDDFLADEDNLVKGPYLSIDLPYQLATDGGEPFPHVPLRFTPYRHQRSAFERLAAGRSTIVATGTGSGKTECFLYPVLDHCRQQAGRRGVKAILIYPMNALASDQARRIAGIIHRESALRGKVTAGLYVGDSGASPRDRMTADHLIENRTVLRTHPPDILLTNYKMLDLLLTRPLDASLWRHNEAGMLRFLAVDELHTFDGAQGTDLACLIRRLRARLQADESLICIGTSATIGGDEDRHAILRYASSLFHQTFDADAIVGETRQQIDEFLGASVINYWLADDPHLGERADPANYVSADDYLSAQYEVFFDEDAGAVFGTPQWRIALGNKLREHASFVNLLRVVDVQAPTPIATVLERLGRSLPVRDPVVSLNILNGLCALVSTARALPSAADERPAPLLNVKLHLWIRELRRMVCSLCEDGSTLGTDSGDSARSSSIAVRRLHYADDTKPDEEAVRLPLVQCRECHATAWGCVHPAGESRIDQDLRTFYNRFFLRDVDVSFLFPIAPGEKIPAAAGLECSVCGGCGYVAEPRANRCPGCGQERLVRVFRPAAVVRGAAGRRMLSRDCPFCGARQGMIILGARASSLLSTALAQLYASHHNDDHKAIAFSDNVQDAAHRGSFFAARTWRTGVRAAIAQVVVQNDRIVLGHLPDRVVAWWGDSAVNADAFDDLRFIGEFIAPDRMWLRHFEALCESGSLPAGSNLLSLVQRRLRWETMAEFTFGAAIGRTLERSRTAAVGVDRDALAVAATSALLRVREQFGELRDIGERDAYALVLGVLRRMKDRGAVCDALFERYLASGNPFAFRDRALQDFGNRSALPVFPSPIADCDAVEALASPKSWYRVWTEKVLTPIHVLAASSNTADVLHVVMDALVAAGLARRIAARKTYVWALDPTRLYVTARTVVLRCRDSSRELVVPAEESDLWRDVPCLDLAAQDRYVSAETETLPTWAGRLYRDAEIRRIVSAEHTALVPKPERDALQERFTAPDAKPWEPNLLSATPTLELGVDIGDLSTVVMCSVPPAPVNYRQRTGRTGRRDGNALALTVATGRPHDLYYYAEPLQMLGAMAAPPGIFLNAPAVLERQLTAFCLDCWVADGVDEQAVPGVIGTVLNTIERSDSAGFPASLFDYVDARGDDLLARFCAAFESQSNGDPGLDEESKAYLAAFLRGTEQRESLRERISRRLQEVARDRQALRNDAEALTRRIRALERGPSDQATNAELRTLRAERSALRSLVTRINQRDTFGFLTDEGLLPNYAFPEQGVTLKSVIFKQRDSDSAEDQADDDTVVYEYLRPEVAALSEFAPENEFYAGGRRVAISRIDTRVSPIEQWRLCPSCAYCENVDAGDRHSVCPRCGDPMWGDTGQRREMLRLRLAHAATPDRRSRIMDERDDREPLFYTRQLVADFDPESVSVAFSSQDAHRPFGFEYVPAATFREVNFGRLDDDASAMAFAGANIPRNGFSLCRRCGGVQDSDGDLQHTRTCTSTGTADIADCLYLYREFRSEAIRILFPAAGSLDPDARVNSFVAALELGLKLRFSGAVDHLRAMTWQFPSESGGDLTYLMLYDTVPGGTGYLKQMAADPANVVEVVRLARDALAACACSDDPEKDGCYRCVYAYRRSYEMASTSRRAAVAILDAILEQAAELAAVPGLRSVRASPVMESALEERFVAALDGFSVDGERVRIRQAVVAAKPGFVLTTAGRTYFVEVQRSFGETDGVAIASRPDFVLRSARESPTEPPVAVFLDGFEYHRDRTDEDSAKRMALVRAGFLVWSLTSEDFADSGSTNGALAMFGKEKHMASLQSQLDARWDSGAIRGHLAERSLTLLVRYLQSPDPIAWKRAVFTEVLRAFQPAEMLTTDLRDQISDATERLPSALRAAFAEQLEDSACARLPSENPMGSAVISLLLALPIASVKTPEPDELLVSLHLHDDDVTSPEYQGEWHKFWRLSNLLQFLPGAWCTTTRGVEREHYGWIDDAAVPAPTGTGPLSLVADQLRPLWRRLDDGGFTAPDVGFELVDDLGRVVAEAELAWPDEQIAVLLPDQDRKPFADAGWKTFLPSDPNLYESVTDALQKAVP